MNEHGAGQTPVEAFGEPETEVLRPGTIQLADVGGAATPAGSGDPGEGAVAGASAVATKSLSEVGALLDVPLAVTVELGRAQVSIRDFGNLAPGSVVGLDKLAGEALDILVNGKLLARGEVVVIDDEFGVRITEIVGGQDRAALAGA